MLKTNRQEYCKVLVTFILVFAVLLLPVLGHSTDWHNYLYYVLLYIDVNLWAWGGGRWWNEIFLTFAEFSWELPAKQVKIHIFSEFYP